MKIIAIDIELREEVSDHVVDTGLSYEEARRKANRLNDHAPKLDRGWFYIVRDDAFMPYVFQKGEEPNGASQQSRSQSAMPDHYLTPDCKEVRVYGKRAVANLKCGLYALIAEDVQVLRDEHRRLGIIGLLDHAGKKFTPQLWAVMPPGMPFTFIKP